LIQEISRLGRAVFDNYYAALNCGGFLDGSFVFIPKGVRCPMELSTYFRINTQDSGQFERTLIVAEEGGYVAYNEGCTAPQFDTNQLHAAVVELVAWTMRKSNIRPSELVCGRRIGQRRNL
jgi:Fe-S cluster assembly scaffold protein SufB